MSYFSSPPGESDQRFSQELKFSTRDKRSSGFDGNFYTGSPHFNSPNRRMNHFRGGRNKRYFDTSDSTNRRNVGGNFSSPYHSKRGNGKPYFRRGGYRSSTADIPVSAYLEPSITQDPWIELERDLKPIKASMEPSDEIQLSSPEFLAQETIELSS